MITMLVLGIESSCDECSVSLVEDGTHVWHVHTYSQLKEHAKYKGVVPELASRVHVQYIASLFDLLLQDAAIERTQIDGIAVTVCPGLSGSLMVGLHFAKGLALALDKPLIGIDHIEAHFYAGRLVSPVSYPYIGMVISGGHTVLAIVHDYNRIEIKGTTIDDACGEAFDKVAREMGLGYPGGALIDTMAQQGDAHAAPFPQYPVKKYGYNMSYSGLKTAVIHHSDKYWNKPFPKTNEHLAASFQHAAISIIIERVEALAKETGIHTIVFGGGVASNTYLRATMTSNTTLHCVFPPVEYCMDNAAMIAGLGYHYLVRNIHDDIDIGVLSRKYQYRHTHNHRYHHNQEK